LGFGFDGARENSESVAGTDRVVSRSPNGGMIVTGSAQSAVHRDLIVILAARHKLPAVYVARFFVTAGGLISYGPDFLDEHRRAAGYVDRILKGENPANGLSERLGQPFIIENRPGGGNNIGTEAVVRAPADGYTLLLAGTPNAVNATLYDKLAARLILFDLEIYRRLLTAVTLNLVLNGLSFIERCQSGTFDGTDVYEHIFSTSLRLNEPVAFGRIEPLHSAGSHAGLLLNRTATE
jgi:hypothetical protein